MIKDIEVKTACVNKFKGNKVAKAVRLQTEPILRNKRKEGGVESHTNIAKTQCKTL